MHLSTPLTVLATLVASTSARRLNSRKAHREILISQNNSYRLLEKHQGSDFFNYYDFFTNSDPTHGYVEYVSQSNGRDLAYVQSDGTVIMKVDNSTQVTPGSSRRSIRISSKNTFNKSLIIADIYAMPHGCSLWPAFWMVGPNWPHNGEIDIIEGVNDMTKNQLTVHTGDGCSLNRNPPNSPFGNTATNPPYSGNIINTQCVSTSSSNAGCSFGDPSSSSFGHGFNMQGGATSAMLINENGIAIWSFPRGTAPKDINSLSPDPSSWNIPPIGFWSSSTCSIGNHFVDLSIVFDITICGDWAGSAYSSPSCPGTCKQAVANSSNFDYAQWAINYVAVYSAP